MPEQKRINVDPISTQSLLLEATVNGNSLSTATGFIIKRGDDFYLITNWHVLAGRDPDSNQPLSPTAGIPDTIRIVMHSKERLGSWLVHEQALLSDNDEKLWLEHPDGQQVDVVALKLDGIAEEIQIYPFNLDLAAVDLVAQPAMPISIVGFPFGLSAGGAWPIWKTGHIATDPDIDYDGRPAFLIDATTRSGMSGSPVIVRISGGYNDSKGNYILAGGVTTKFMGVYSGRIHGQAEIGRVWRPHVIESILGN